MSDLDARVAALMDLADKHASSGMQITADQFVNRKDPTQARCDHLADYEALEAAIRAELQKPALHEPVTDVEIHRALAVYLADEVSIVSGWRKALESFLQGRAKPAQNNLAGLLAALYYGQYSTNEDKKSLDKNIELALKNYDIGAGEFVQPAQEEITDDELLRACINASDSLNITRVHEIGGKTRTIMEDAGLLEIARAVIRASKGEKT